MNTIEQQPEKPPPDHEERLAALEAMSKSHEERLNKGAELMQRMQADLETSTKATVAIKADTSEIVDFFNSMKGAFKVLDWIGKAARPLAAIAAFATAMWAAWTHGGPR